MHLLRMHALQGRTHLRELCMHHRQPGWLLPIVCTSNQTCTRLQTSSVQSNPSQSTSSQQGGFPLEVSDPWTQGVSQAAGVPAQPAEVHDKPSITVKRGDRPGLRGQQQGRAREQSRSTQTHTTGGSRTSSDSSLEPSQQGPSKHASGTDPSRRRTQSIGRRGGRGSITDGRPDSTSSNSRSQAGLQQRQRPAPAPSLLPPSPGRSHSVATNERLTATGTGSSSTSSPSDTTIPASVTPANASASTMVSCPTAIAIATDAASAFELARLAGSGPVTASQHEACFAAAVASHGLTVSQAAQLTTYLDYMLETNKVMNLTAVRDRSEALTRHLVDSLALLPVIEQHAPKSLQGAALRLVDVGTGAGLPGMVLAAARPQWRITLLDTLRKRCDFLKRAAQEAGLENVEVVWCRAEDGARKPELRDVFDVAVARAVADSRVLAELCMPYVRPNGVWVAAKGPDPEVEVAAAAPAIKLLGGQPALIERVASFSADGQRTAVVVHKARPTPPQYPRAPGTPNKSPL